MTARYIGGGHKKKYRIIDFKRNKFNESGKVLTVEYDPNRSAYISLVEYGDGEKRYILAPNGIQVGQEIISGDNVVPEVGNALKLKNMPLGSTVHNIELAPGNGGIMARSAGTYAQLLARDGKYVVLKMPSGEARMVLGECMATIGVVSNTDHGLTVKGKAGRNQMVRKKTKS